MNRRVFTARGLAAAFAAMLLVRQAHSLNLPQAHLILRKNSPVQHPEPRPCTSLGELPEPPSAATSQKHLPGFQAGRIRTSCAEINVLTKGNDPPLLLIHGHPETHQTWRKIASALTEEYAVVLLERLVQLSHRHPRPWRTPTVTFGLTRSAA